MLSLVVWSAFLVASPTEKSFKEKILQSAQAQVEVGATYDASYRQLKFPGGDVPKNLGACTDVVIRALRAAGHDLQVLVQQDRKRSPRSYPFIKKVDRNIDHRRVRNLVPFFTRNGLKLPHRNWEPGDFVVWKLPNGLDHIGIVTKNVGPSGNLKVVHNIWKCAEEDVLTSWRIVGRYKYPK